MLTPNQDIVAWLKRFYIGKLDKNSQGPFYAENIPEYTQQTLSTGLSKRGKHKYNKTTCDVPAHNMSKLSVAQDEMIGSIVRKRDVHTIDKLVPRQHRSSDTCIGNSNDTRISDNNNIITNNINKFSTRKRAYPTLDFANSMVINRVDTIPTRISSQISSLNSDSDIANSKVSTHLASAISCDNPFVMLALEQIQAAIVGDKSSTKQVLDREDYEPPTRRLMLQCKHHVKWEEA
jgi:hypothetical protein